MKNLKPKSFLYLAIGCIPITALIGYLPYKHLSALEQTIAVTQKKVESKSEVDTKLATAQTQLASDQTQLQHLEANVSSYGYVPSLLIDLDKYGKSCGLKVTGVRPHPPTTTSTLSSKAGATKPYDELQIDVTGQGNFASLEKFVDGLSQFPKIVAAYSITVLPHHNENSAQPGSGNLLNVTVTLNTYIFKSNSAPTQNPTANHAAGNPATALGAANKLAPNSQGGKIE